jgi:hypothetical protein
VRLAGCAAVGAGLIVALTAAAPPGAAHLVTSDKGLLKDVSADSPSDAWAVGAGSGRGAAIALHRSGTSWAEVPLPDASGIEVDGVSALSPGDAWAVGAGPGKPYANTLVLRWNGTSWRRVPSPSPDPGRGSGLDSVSADSPSDAWAVGAASAGAPGNSVMLALRWAGTSWQRVPTPSPAASAGGDLVSVSADSPSDAWAVGSYFPGKKLESLALHWNGVSWRRVPIPIPGSGTFNDLQSVTAVSPTDAWAVGGYFTGHIETAEVLHWNGASWKQMSLPNPGDDSVLTGISAASATNVWATGGNLPGNLMLHWNGTGWSKVASPDPLNAASLSAVSTVSGSDAWAAGCVCTDSKAPDHTLLLHWDGKSWARS